MFVKNLSKVDLTYRANNKTILLKAGRVTRIDDTQATAQDIKNAFIHHVDIITPYDDLGIVDEKLEEVIEELVEEVIEKDSKTPTKKSSKKQIKKSSSKKVNKKEVK